MQKNIVFSKNYLVTTAVFLIFATDFLSYESPEIFFIYK